MRIGPIRSRNFVMAAWATAALWSASSAEASSDLNLRLRRVVQNSPISINNVTWCILDSNGAPLSEHNASRPMKPASTMKLLTTAAAFEHLPAFYRTKLWAHESEAGTVLRWVGAGDPMMGDPGPLNDNRVPGTLLGQLATEIKRSGVTEVIRLEYDDSYFQPPRYHPNWDSEQFSKPYRCESSALNFAGNLVRLELHPRPLKPRLELFPSEASEIIVLQDKFTDLRTTREKDVVGFDRSRGRNEFRAWGVCRNQHVLESPVHDPSRWAAELLATRLRMEGIVVLQVTPAQSIDNPPQGNPIPTATINTPLFRVAQHCNTNSRNLYAECLLKSVDRQLGGDGTWLASGPDNRTAGERLSHALSTLFPEAMGSGDVIDDGSGLSHENRLSARTLARILCQAQSREWYPEWLQTLAVGRKSGTLANRFRSKAFGHCVVRGKSGYIDGVSTLAGRVDQDDDQHLFFAIMVKDVKSSRDAKKLHESILAEAIQVLPRASESNASTNIAQNHTWPTQSALSKAPPTRPTPNALPHPNGEQLRTDTNPMPSGSEGKMILTGTAVALIVLGIRLR